MSLPPSCTASALGGPKAWCGSWQVAQAIRPEAESDGSENKLAAQRLELRRARISLRPWQRSAGDRALARPRLARKRAAQPRASQGSSNADACSISECQAWQRHKVPALHDSFLTVRISSPGPFTQLPRFRRNCHGTRPVFSGRYNITASYPTASSRRGAPMNAAETSMKNSISPLALLIAGLPAVLAGDAAAQDAPQGYRQDRDRRRDLCGEPQLRQSLRLVSRRQRPAERHAGQFDRSATATARCSRNCRRSGAA